MPSTAKPLPSTARLLPAAVLLVALCPCRTAAEEVEELPTLHVGESRLQLGLIQGEGASQRQIDPGQERYSLPLLLQGLPGVVALESFGGIEPPRISIRGSGLQSAPVARGFLPRWNGLPLCWADLSFNAAWLDLALADELVLRRGPAAWLENTGTLGGSLELLSRTGFHPNRRIPAADSGPASLVSNPELGFTLQADGEGSHWGRLSASLQADPQGASPIELLLRASTLRSSGFRPHSDQSRDSAWLEFGEGANHFSLLALKGRHQVPGPLLLQEAYAATWALPSTVARDKPEREFNLQRLGWRSGFPCGAGWLEGGLGIQKAYDRFQQLQANGISVQDSLDTALFLYWKSNHEPRSGENQWLVRLDLLGGTRRAERFLNTSGTMGARICDDRLEAQSHAVLLQYRRELLPGLRAEIGLSAELWVRDRRNRQDISGGALSRDWSDSRLLPSLLLAKEFGKHLELHAAWTRMAEAPTFDDLMPLAGSGSGLHSTNQALRTQTADTVELGLTWRNAISKVECVAYESAWKGELLRLTDAAGNPLGTLNAGKTRHQGLELAAQHRLRLPGGVLRLTQSVTLQELRFEGDQVRGDGRLAGFPPLSGQSTLHYQYGRLVWLATSLDYTAGRTQADHAGRLGYGGSAMLGLEAGWRIHRHLTLQAGVRNLLDRRAIASTAGVLDLARNPATTALFLPAPPRRYTVSVTSSW
jgi:iron complex outermembrane receptor protein